MKSIADKNATTLDRYLPLNFTSLLNQFSDNIKAKQLLSSIGIMKKNLTCECVGSLALKYKELIDLSKIKEMNLEKDSFFNNYKKKLSVFKNFTQMPIRKMLRQASCYQLKMKQNEKESQPPSTELDYDKIKSKVTLETAKIVKEMRRKVRKSFSRMAAATMPIKTKPSQSTKCSPVAKAITRPLSKLDDYYLGQHLVLRKPKASDLIGTNTVYS